MPRSSASKKAWRLANAIVPDVARRRVQWTKSIKIASDPERLVFIDETWTSDRHDSIAGMAPPRGRRLTAKVPHGRWEDHDFPGGIAP